MCKVRYWLIFVIFVTIPLLLFINYLVPIVSVHKYGANGGKKLVVVPKETMELSLAKESSEEPINDSNNSYCEVIHVGFVCAGEKSNLYLHTLLKSLYFYKVNPVHFHLLVNNFSEKVLRTLFDTWKIPQTKTTFYDINDSILDVRWVPNSHYSGVFGLLKLVFPKIIPLNVTNRIIILDTDIIFNGDIYELWKMFENFSNKQAIGIVDNQSNFYLGKNTKIWPASGRGYNSGVILYQIERLKKLDWPALWANVTKQVALIYGSTRLGDQDVINAVLLQHTELLYEVPCYWNTQLSDNSISFNCYKKHKPKVIHWNSPKKTKVYNKDKDYFMGVYTSFLGYDGNLLKGQLVHCEAQENTTKELPSNVCSEFYRAKTAPWRTLLFFRSYEYQAMNNDVTLMAQLSFERLQLVEDLVKEWPGPVSLIFYVTDPEFQESLSFIENSTILSERKNIAYHAVFKDGEYYPINMLRNVGLTNINTLYVFLSDIDFIPMKGLYSVLRQELGKRDMTRQALIVPAFETQRYRAKIPKNKAQLLGMINKKTVFPFRFDVWKPGHAPTDYNQWKIAVEPYKVMWKPDYEPYIVVRSDVTLYDDRFIGFGWNKVSHIMELEAQRYSWIVLPNAFIVHKSHAPSYDIAKFRTSGSYRMCLQNLKEEFISELQKKYSTFFDTKNTSLPLSSLSS